MAVTAIRGNTQIKLGTVDVQRLMADFLGGSDWDVTNGIKNATLKGLKDAVLDDSPATLGQLNTAIAGMSGGLDYKGSFDASALGAQLDNGAKGDFYIVTVSGVILSSLSLSAGDHIIINKDVVGTPVLADIDVIDNSEALDILRDADIVANLTSTDDTKVLAASQGKVLQDQITVLQNAQTIDVFNEKPLVTPGIAVLAALANAPLMGSLRVYLNGVRQDEGAGEDYTANYSTGIVTFTAPLAAGDKASCDYKF
jgi:hypothetical protein